MSVGAVGSSYGSLASMSLSAQSSPAPSVRREAENDGDKDDGAGAAAAVRAPTLNLSGQVVGAVINTLA
ncbi:hypothetical protein [Propionivibrio dicarboxylicus]|uniref:Uncharacterized protein n=1 Tax=Propionivibrio dicarboxylicus TaxID=83767 RepID=A0A1G8KGN0_9RHOO|nr:hypothetical protein [Propionivibrio dicarboxylicus]SDI42020.1 hypothetical protein SAMN05660652_03409 [Propionivibrio dicarboxylicus]